MEAQSSNPLFFFPKDHIQFHKTGMGSVAMFTSRVKHTKYPTGPMKMKSNYTYFLFHCLILPPNNGYGLLLDMNVEGNFFTDRTLQSFDGNWFSESENHQIKPPRRANGPLDGRKGE